MVRPISLKMTTSCTVGYFSFRQKMTRFSCVPFAHSHQTYYTTQNNYSGNFLAKKRRVYGEPMCDSIEGPRSTFNLQYCVPPSFRVSELMQSDIPTMEESAGNVGVRAKESQAELQVVKVCMGEFARVATFSRTSRKNLWNSVFCWCIC